MNEKKDWLGRNGFYLFIIVVFILGWWANDGVRAFSDFSKRMEKNPSVSTVNLAYKEFYDKWYSCSRGDFVGCAHNLDYDVNTVSWDGKGAYLISKDFTGFSETYCGRRTEIFADASNIELDDRFEVNGVSIFKGSTLQFKQPPEIHCLGACGIILENESGWLLGVDFLYDPMNRSNIYWILKRNYDLNTEDGNLIFGLKQEATKVKDNE